MNYLEHIMLNERPHTAQFHLYEMCRDKRIEKGGRPGVAGEGEEGVTANSHPVSWGGWKYFTIRLWQWERDTRVPESHTPMWKVCSCPEGSWEGNFPAFLLPAQPFLQAPWGHSCHGNRWQRHCCSSAWHANLLILVLDFTLREMHPSRWLGGV